MRVIPVAALAIACTLASPASAGNTLVAAGAPVSVAKSALTVTPPVEWNRLGFRPGPNAETWTLDGDTLNDLTFYGGIADGQPIIREIAKKTKPLPRFSASMLLSDVPALFEQTYRVAFDTSVMDIDQVEPTVFAGAKGVHFTYRFSRESEGVRRRGDAYAAIVSGKLYMINFEAPATYYFDKSAAAAKAIVASATMH